MIVSLILGHIIIYIFNILISKKYLTHEDIFKASERKELV
ncbi:hypothetical protein CSCA_1255 [Clostridium scatologenes]|uniref:Uncharacterized protein n=1 Tax=Clostridium scatologenes TaxID=1548 RepID=A0A0E3JXQ4_CLOSL|nr:hypothetical protein CSCA_1255 [Clostridium scatologenes]